MVYQTGTWYISGTRYAATSPMPPPQWESPPVHHDTNESEIHQPYHPYTIEDVSVGRIYTRGAAGYLLGDLTGYMGVSGYLAEYLGIPG